MPVSYLLFKAPSTRNNPPSPSSVKDRVARFNELPRPKLVCEKYLNFYHFDIKHIAGQPGDFVWIINPFNSHRRYGGYAAIANRPVDIQAKIIVPILLGAFIGGFDPFYLYPRASCFEIVGAPAFVDDFNISPLPAPWAPRAWGTSNPELARAVTKNLKELGVVEDLWRVSLTEGPSVETSDREWKIFEDTALHGLEGRNAPSLQKLRSTNEEFGTTVWQYCDFCGITRSPGISLEICARCKRVWYCSQACQDIAFKSHKFTCKKPVDMNTSRTESMVGEQDGS